MENRTWHFLLFATSEAGRIDKNLCCCKRWDISKKRLGCNNMLIFILAPPLRALLVFLLLLLYLLPHLAFAVAVHLRFGFVLAVFGECGCIGKIIKHNKSPAKRLHSKRQ